MKLNRFYAPLATLALVALVAGCPNNTQPPPTDVKASKKPSTEPTGTATGTPSPATGTSPTPKASATGTLPPASVAPTTSVAPTASATTSAAPSTAASTASDYIQVERLARPAINEGLIRDPGLLNAWNSVGPAVDLAEVQAAKDIRANAVGTLKALGNDDTQVGSIVGSFLPDVIRIDTTLASGYVTPSTSAAGTFNNLSATKKIPIGGRMIKDDVMDATLQVLVPNGLPASGKIAGLESDGVAYEDNHSPLMTTFPYLAEPN